MKAGIEAIRNKETVKTKLGRKQVLPCEAENGLAEHYHLMERKGCS
jgi:hypothetical protein